MPRLCVVAAGEFGNVEVFGPVALDCALLRSAADAKGIKHEAAGYADCMVGCPNIEAGNLLGKAVKYLADRNVRTWWWGRRCRF